MAVVVEVVVEVGGRGVGGLVEEAVLGEGLVEGAFGGGFVAVEGVEGGAAGLGVEGEDVGRGGVGGEGEEVGVGGFALLVVAGVVEEADLGLGDAAELPGEEGDAFGEVVFEGVAGVERLSQVGEEVGEQFAFV